MLSWYYANRRKESLSAIHEREHLIVEDTFPSDGRLPLVFTFRPNQAVFITVFKRI
jgi:hypothetical protein